MQPVKQTTKYRNSHWLSFAVEFIKRLTTDLNAKKEKENDHTTKKENPDNKK